VDLERGRYASDTPNTATTWCIQAWPSAIRASSSIRSATRSSVRPFKRLDASSADYGIAANENKLTDLVFFACHPELSGRRIRPDEKELTREWLEIRN
jgi:hypothetical protein